MAPVFGLSYISIQQHMHHQGVGGDARAAADVSCTACAYSSGQVSLLVWCHHTQANGRGSRNTSLTEAKHLMTSLVSWLPDLCHVPICQAPCQPVGQGTIQVFLQGSNMLKWKVFQISILLYRNHHFGFG